MLKKIIVFVIFSLLFFPSLSYAMGIVYSAHLTIVVNTMGGDGAFPLDLKEYNGIYLFSDTPFNIQTQNFSASAHAELDLFSGTTYLLMEQIPDGWNLTGANCSSDLPGNSFTPITGGINISPSVINSNITCTFTNTKAVAKPDPVIIIPGILGSQMKDDKWVIDPIFHTYDDLIDTLAANGYVKGETLFDFPYDWRVSNVLTAVNLRDKISEVKSICKCDKVDLVAHSMGGLVARQYIESPMYQGDVDQLIFLGTPHLGAPKAYLAWEGATLTSNRVDQAIKYLMTWDAYKLGLSLFEYIRQDVPSLEQLLPTTDYLTLKSAGILENYPSGYPQNSFLENLNDNSSKLINSGVRIYNIVGNTGNSTIASITVASSSSSNLWQYGQPNTLNYGEGDETVPIQSASYINNNLTTFDFSHSELPGRAEDSIYKILTGNNSQNSLHNGLRPDAVALIQILSPADIQVIAPDGSRIGKDFNTGQEINEIPGAFYSGFSADNEFIAIPNPSSGDYVVKTVGTDSGLYTVASALISDTTSDEQEVKGTTKAGFSADIPLTITDDGKVIVDQPSAEAVTPDSVIADIENAYAKGWIKNKGIENVLIQEIKAIIKIEKRMNTIKEKVNGKYIEKKIQTMVTKVDKIMAKVFEKELELYRKTNLVNQNAYDLIKNDVELLMIVY